MPSGATVRTMRVAPISTLFMHFNVVPSSKARDVIRPYGLCGPSHFSMFYIDTMYYGVTHPAYSCLYTMANTPYLLSE